MGETLARHIFEVNSIGNSNSEGENSMSENEINEITEKTFVKLSLPAFVTLLLALISVVFSVGIFVWQIQNDVDNKVNQSQYIQDRLRDSITTVQDKKMAEDLEYKIDAIGEKLNVDLTVPKKKEK